ncbi:hypothetical protein HPC49_31190 [Pyxidicoccus fallax]|uniref:Tail specific protease domain-containing protein n=1 Tax=Pyxidicoccus fallax TaxID=394095 RepID=A0A848L4T3_9BACT|nr:S41 family peptidase [Pyxidicoccus fallax]NMO13636.1 hypothetical protein [Pyxidicoccus fallax]NPC82676.1 hypothetical protein [Pyxidicoccus fallax]
MSSSPVLRAVRGGVLAACAAVLASCASVPVAPTPSERLSPEALRADLRFVVETLEARHPDLSYSVDRGELDRVVAEVERSLDHPMTRDEAWAALARLNPAFADAHVLIGFQDWRRDSRAHLARGGGFFPFEVSLREDGTPTLLTALGGGPTPYAGRRLARINGRDARELTRELLARMHGDTPKFRAALLSRRWWLYTWKLHGAPAHFELALDGGEVVRVPASRVLPSLLQQEDDFESLYRLELLDGGNALLTLGSFSSSDKARYFDFCREAFDQMKRAGTRRLIIDLRDNGGGDDDMWKEGILRYVARRPYRAGSSYLKRVQESSVKPGETAGQVVAGEISSLEEPRLDEPLRFEGEVWLLIGPLTYSSAVLFSNVVQDYGFGHLAGVGGAVRVRQSGGVQSTVLPHTGLTLSFPRFVLDRPSGAREPALLQPREVIDLDPLRPRAAIEALLSRTANRPAP